MPAQNLSQHPDVSEVRMTVVSAGLVPALLQVRPNRPRARPLSRHTEGHRPLAATPGIGAMRVLFGRVGHLLHSMCTSWNYRMELPRPSPVFVGLHGALTYHTTNVCPNYLRTATQSPSECHSPVPTDSSVVCFTLRTTFRLYLTRLDLISLKPSCCRIPRRMRRGLQEREYVRRARSDLPSLPFLPTVRL
jgi:hypothetical protein